MSTQKKAPKSDARLPLYDSETVRDAAELLAESADHAADVAAADRYDSAITKARAETVEFARESVMHQRAVVAELEQTAIAAARQLERIGLALAAAQKAANAARAELEFHRGALKAREGELALLVLANDGGAE